MIYLSSKKELLMINYSKDFTKRIKNYFGLESHAYHLCTYGEEALGLILANEIRKNITYSQLFSAKSLKELQNTAEFKINLYEDWYEDMKKAYPDEEGLQSFLKSRNMYIDITSLKAESGINPNC